MNTLSNIIKDENHLNKLTYRLHMYHEDDMSGTLSEKFRCKESLKYKGREYVVYIYITIHDTLCIVLQDTTCLTDTVDALVGKTYKEMVGDKIHHYNKICMMILKADNKTNVIKETEYDENIVLDLIMNNSTSVEQFLSNLEGELTKSDVNEHIKKK